jgi:hypothetical protein
MMMYKLLAEIDFRHFQETGLPITNLKYEAFPWGPVPKALHDEITKKDDLVLPDDFQDSLSVKDLTFMDEKGNKHKGFIYIPRRKPNLSLFSPRQQRIMESVAFIYRNATPTEASMASHEPDKPWTITVEKKGEGAIIEMIETIRLNKPLTTEIASEKMREREAMIFNYGE